MAERSRTVTLRGRPLILAGHDLRVGEAVPDFHATRMDLSAAGADVLRGRVCLISCVTSLDTSVCGQQTHRLADMAAALSKEIKVLTVSMDLPFAMKRWAEMAGVVDMEFLSDHREGSLGRAFGMLIEDLRLLGRGLFVTDRGGVLRYSQIVEELSREPDYEPALQAASDLV